MEKLSSLASAGACDKWRASALEIAYALCTAIDSVLATLRGARFLPSTIAASDKIIGLGCLQVYNLRNDKTTGTQVELQCTHLKPQPRIPNPKPKA